MKFRTLIEKLLARVARNKRLDSLWIGTLLGNGEHYICRVEDSLKVIKQYDLTRYRRILHEIEEIWIVPLYGESGMFDPRSPKRCYLDYRYVAVSSHEAIASTIIHEATHARLWRRGIGISEELRHRFEKICIRQELSFAFRLPECSELRARLENDLMLPATTWSGEIILRHRLERWRAELRHAGVPGWLVKLATAFHRTHGRLSIMSP